MNPATRSTLFRIVLAVHLFEVGLVTAARYALPKKYKKDYYSPYAAWVMRKFMKSVLPVIRNGMVAAKLINREYDQHFRGEIGSKIGDTLEIRRPTRYAGRFA